MAEPFDDESTQDPVAEYDALMQRHRAPAAEQEQVESEPEVGTSETARQLQDEGYFDGLARQFGHERETRTQRAVEESQGFSENSIVRSVQDFFNRPEGQEYGPQSRRGHDAIYGPNSRGRLSPEERQAAAQSELETAEGTASAARRRADAIPPMSPELSGPGLMVPRNILAMTRGLFNADAVKQETRLARAQSMLRGEAELPQYAEWRSLTESGAKTVADMFTTLPIQYAGIVGGYAMGGGEFQDNRLYKFGQSVERAVQQAFPGDPARQFEYSHTLVQGLASTMAFGGQGAIAHLLGAGPKGQLALIALSGMAAQTPPEFARVTQAMERGGATERDRIIAVLANSALGATEAIPFANTIGGPQRGLSAMVARGGEQALEEMGQEALQQGGQNVTRMLTYDPKQDPYEGVLESMVVAAISGFGYGSAFSGGGRQQGERPPVVEARAGGARTQTQPPAAEATPAPQTQPVQPETVAPIIPQVDPALDPFNLERFAPAPELTQDGQTQVSAPVVPSPETAAPESDLGRIAAMADRPSDTPAAPAVLPPDVLEYLRETNPELAERYDNSDISGAAPDAAAAPPLPTLRERLEALNQGRQDADPALEATVDANLPAYHADMEDVLARLEIATPLSDTDVRAVARHMARDNLTAEEALERHAVEAYEAERQARAQPETVGVRQAPQQVQAPAAPAGGTGGQPAGARAGSPGTAQLGTAGARPAGSAAPAATGQPQRGTEQAPAAASTRDAAGADRVAEPTPQQRTFLNRILGQKKPLKWSEVQGRLRASPEQMEALRQEALAEGLLRRDRHGVYRRTAKVAAAAEAGMPSLQNPNALSIPPDVRIDNSIRIREALTGKPVSPLVRSAAIRLLARLGRPQFTTILSEVKKDGGLKVADVRDLAALVGYPPTARTSKADAFRLISARHLDQKGFLERQARSQQMAALEPARSLEEREAAARARMETPEWISAGEKPADPSLYTYNQKGYLSPEWAAERRYVGANGDEIVGVADAVNYLVEQAEALVPGGVAREKKAYLIIGFPGAGKSTIARALSKQYRAAHMVSDIPKAIIPEYDGGKNGEGVHEESSDLSDFATDELVERGDNIILETLGTWPKVAKRAAYFLSRGYQPSLVFVDVPKAVAMERAVERWQRSGRAVPLHTFDLNPQEAYANALDKGAVDEAARVTLSSDEQGWVVGEATGAFGVLADAIEEQVQARNARMVRGAGGRLAGRPDRVRRDDGGESEDGGRIGDPTDETTKGPGNEGLPAFQGSSPALDMSPAARKARAEAMGFDTSRVWYHGTNKKLRQFDPTSTSTFRRIEGRPTEITPQVSFFTSDPDEARMFARDKVEIDKRLRSKSGGRPVVEAYYLRTGNTLDFVGDGINPSGVNSEAAGLVEEVSGYYPQSWTDVQALLDDPRVIDALRDEGYDSTRQLEDSGAESIAVFDPSNIRSVNAAFDPSQEGSSQLMAGYLEPRPYTQAFQSRSAEVAAAIQRELERAVGSIASVRMVDRINVGAFSAAERVQSFSDGRLVLEVALSDPQTMRIKGRHGIVHVLKEAGLWDESKEWPHLVDRAEKLGIQAELENEIIAGTTISFWEGYTQSYEVYGPERQRDLLEQELVTRLAEKWEAGQRPGAERVSYGATLDALLDRIVKALDAIRQALNSIGITALDQVLEPASERAETARDRDVHDILARGFSGQVAARATGGRIEPTFDPFPIKPSPEEYHLSTEEGMAAVDLLMGTASAEAMFALKGQPDAETRSFSIPGFNGSVEEKIKASGERIRTYNVKPDIAVTATEPGQSPLQPSQSLIVSEQADGSWELSFFKGSENVQQVVAAIESDIGNRLSPKGWLTPQGYRYWQSADPQAVRYHQIAGDVFGGMYASPRAVEFGVAVLGKPDTTGTASESDPAPLLPSQDFAERTKAFASVALRRPALDLGGGLTLVKKAKVGGAPSVEYKVMRGDDVIADALVSAPRHLSPTIGEMFDIKYGRIKETDLPFVGTVDRIDVEPEYQTKQLATKILDEAENDLATVGAGIQPGGSFTKKGVEFGARWYPEAMFDALRRAGHNAYSDKMLTFARAMRELGRPVNVSAAPPKFVPRRSAPRDSQSGDSAVKSGTPEMSALSRLKSNLPPEAFASERNEQMFSFESSQDGSPVLMAAFAPGSVRGIFGRLFGKNAVSASEVDQVKTPPASELSLRRETMSPRETSRGWFSYDIMQGPTKIGNVSGAARGDTATIGYIFAKRIRDGAIEGIGLRGLKALREEFRKDFPGVTVFEGARVSGARAQEFDGEDEDAPVQRVVMPAFSSDDSRAPPYLAPPGQVAQPASPTGGKEGDVRGLADIIEDLKETLGLTTTQGRYGLTVVDREGGRRFRFPAQSNVRGQYDRNAGVARIRIATDIDAIAHEGGHHLERVFGAELDALKQAHAEELGTPPAPNAPLPKLAPTGYSGLELDADTQGVLVEAATAMRAWRAMATRRGDAAYHEASATAAMATGVLERRLGKPIAQALIGDILGDARIAPGVIGQSPLRRAIETGAGTTIQEVAPEDMAAYVAERYSRTGVPQPRNVPAPSPLQVSEGFAEFFRRYIVDPDTVQRDMPGVYSAFEEFLDAADPAMLENLEKLQLTALSEDYKAYRTATAVDRGVADVATMQDMTKWEKIKDFFQSDNKGDRINQWLSLLSYTAFDRTNPVLKTQQALLRVADANDVRDSEGRPLSLRAGEDAHKIARMLSGADKIGHQFITEGIPDYNGMEPVGPSLHDALVEAFGGARGYQWSDTAIRRFGLYLEARRAIAEWPRYQAGEIPSPPTRRSFEENWQIIQDLEKSNPSYRSAAQKVYDWQHRLLTLEYQAGKWTKEAYDELSKRKNFYVPFQRDLSDLTPTTGAPPGSQLAKRFTASKRFQGSQRDIINPIESLARRAYGVAASVQFNDMVKALAGLSERAGPGGAGFIERVQKEEILANNERTFERIKQAAITNGVDLADAHIMVQQMEMNFSDADVQLLWDPDNLGPNRPPVVPLWEDGVRKLVRLNDPIMGRRLFDAMNGLGREMAGPLIRLIGIPALVLRAGVTMNPTFILSNVMADMLAAWTLTGAPPLVTQAKGAYYLFSTNPKVKMALSAMGLTPPKFAQMYNSVGGIAGGMNVAALRKSDFDLRSLRQRGFHVFNLPSLGALGAVGSGLYAGGLAGGAVAGPVGAVVGATIGAGTAAIAARLAFGEGAERAFAHLSELSETVTRLGVAAHAFKRVKKFDPTISDIDALREAAFTARDVIDFDRSGAKIGSIMRVVGFLNAGIQGVSKGYRQTFVLDGDRGRMNMEKVRLFLRWQLTRNAGPMKASVSANEQRAIQDGARLWVHMAILAMAGVALAFLHQDDPEYDDVRKETRYTHFIFKVNGVWVRIKKPFELATFANMAEAFFEWWAKEDPRLGRKLYEGIKRTHMPPHMPQAYAVATGWVTNVDAGTGRDIVPEGMSRLPAHMQYGAYTSRFSYGWSQALHNIGVNVSPAMIDWTLNNELAYWGREIRITSDYLYGNRAPKWTDVPIAGTMVNRFTVDPSRQSASIEEFWTIMSRGKGDFDQAAAGYDLRLKEGNANATRAYLAGLSPEERTYAVLNRHFRANDQSAHPLNRANIIHRIDQGMRREMADQGLINTAGGERGTTIPLSPNKITQIDDILGRLSAIEVWNALHDIGRPGWAQRDIRNPQPVLDELSAASPDAFDEMMRRRRNGQSVGLRGRVGDYAEDRERWTEIEQRVNEMIVTDDLLGLAWERTFRRRKAPTRRMEESTTPPMPAVPQPGPSPVQVPY